MLKVAFAHVFTTFYARLALKGITSQDSSEQSWDEMCVKARYDPDEKVYPPKPSQNR